MKNLLEQKHAARVKSRHIRKTLFEVQAGQNLIKHIPESLSHSVIAGFAPIGDEIDVWPLLHHVHDAGRQVALPVVVGPATPLAFREWTPQCEMSTDRYGVEVPMHGAELTPTLVLVPLLAFTADGRRLGYGGGYYDRSLSQLRAKHDVFACGVAYAGQEVADLPTDAHDQRLDAILTEKDFRMFT